MNRVSIVVFYESVSRGYCMILIRIQVRVFKFFKSDLLLLYLCLHLFLDKCDFSRLHYVGMTNETELPSSEDVNRINNSTSNSTSSNSNEEPKRRVSISQAAIQADKERQKRNNSIISSRSNITNGDSGNNCYVNPTFQHCPSEKRTSVSSYNVSRLRNCIETVAKSEASAETDHSWWYVFCMKCRQKEVGPGWEPNFWPKLCPHPFCPAYRQVARVIALFVIGLLIWGTVYFIMGREAAPGGQLFNIALLCLTAHFVGWIFRIVTLPALLGMLITGIVFQNIGLISISEEYGKMTSLLRKISLVVLLTRAGLDLDPEALKKLYLRVITLGLVPWLIEAIMMALLAHFLLSFPWLWSMLLGCIVAAVAPAVVVPCLIRLRNKGYGVAKGIPTLIIAVAGINDGLSVVFFGLFHSIMFSQHSLVYEIFIGPVSIAMGLGYGLVWGMFAKLIPEREDPFVVPLRVLMLFCGGMVAVLGSELYGFEGAGPLGVISAAFISIYYWSKQGWHIEDNPVVTAFEIFWMLCEPVLFSLTGTQVVFSQLERETVIYGGALIFICFIARIALTMLIAAGSSLNTKEKFFVALSWMSKASVQAVLAPAALESVRKSTNPDILADLPYAKILVTICIMSMLITVPIGAISISSTGSRLLTKTKHTIPVEGWRRSARPSLRDITIIDEEVENYDTDDNETEKNNGKIHMSSDTEQDLNDVTTPVFTHVN